MEMEQTNDESIQSFGVDVDLCKEIHFEVGRKIVTTCIFTQEQVNTFANLTGDKNPIHVDENYAKRTIFKGTIVHGMLLSSYFSAILAKVFIGGVYVSQSTAFKKPVLVGAHVKDLIEVKGIDSSKKGRLITLKTQIYSMDGKMAVDGEGKVMILQTIIDKNFLS